MTEELYKKLMAEEFPEVILPLFGDTYYRLDAHQLLAGDYRAGYYPINTENLSYFDAPSKAFTDCIASDWLDCYMYLKIVLRNSNYDVVEEKDIIYNNRKSEK